MVNEMKDYAFEYRDGKNTTTGIPHRQTGRLSIAGNLEVFNSKIDRDNWINDGYPSGRRISTNKKDAKSKFFAGWSVDDYLYMIECFM